MPKNRYSRERMRARKENRASRASKRAKQHRLSLIKEKQAAEIHLAVLKILGEIGVIIEHPPTEVLLVKHGATVGGDGYLRIPEAMVAKAIESVPTELLLYDRSGNIRVNTSSDLVAYAAGHNCVRTLDFRTKELRSGSLNDIRRTAIVTEACPNLDMVASLGYPTDVPPEDEALETVKAMTANATKPLAFLAHDDAIQIRIFEHLADIAGGKSKLADKPFALELMGPVSPLKLPGELCLRLINCARWGVPVVCYPATFPGMSCPITTAGAIAQSSAEALAGIIIHQIAEPGSPIMSGSAILPMDMRQADLAYGSPEYLVTGLSAADYFQMIGIPTWVGAGCSDSHDFDQQAASEAAAGIAIAALANASFVHNLGFLSGGRTGSIELLVLCDELVGWASQLAAGCTVDADSIAYEVVKRAAPDNAYLTDDHTQSRYLTENWYPNIFERSDADAWTERGSQDLRTRIGSRLEEILAPVGL